jgi:hypothetical protein
MSFEISIDGVDPLLKKFDAYAEQLKELQTTMPEELVKWQREDMHRHFPNVETTVGATETDAVTSIWPRSRQSERRPVAASGKGPRTHRPKTASPVRQVSSHRPILRPELFEKLHDRMLDLLRKTMKWP